MMGKRWAMGVSGIAGGNTQFPAGFLARVMSYSAHTLLGRKWE